MQVLEAGRREPVGGLARRAVLLMGQLGVAVQVPIEVLLPTADLSGTGEDCGDGIVHRSSMGEARCLRKTRWFIAPVRRS